MSQASVAPRDARALIVSRTGSKPSGWRAAASSHPPISNTGAHAEDSTAHPGTRLLRMGSLAQDDHIVAADRVALAIQVTVHPDLCTVVDHHVLVQNRPAHHRSFAHPDARHQHASLDMSTGLHHHI